MITGAKEEHWLGRISIFTTILLSIEGETEAQRKQVTYSRPHS